MDFSPPALNSEEIVIAVDSTGIKVHNRGEWMREKWKRRRGWIKIHFAVDIETKQIVAYEVTDEQIHDNGKFKDLIEKSEEKAKVKRVLADKAYDSYDNFEFLQSKGIDPAIPVRKGAIDILTHPRSEEVRKQKDFDRWKEKKEYGLRWTVETVYSAFKRYFGEFVSAKKWNYMLREIAAKVWIYNSLRSVLC
jgi:transposase